MTAVRSRVHGAIATAASADSSDSLAAEDIDIVSGTACFVDSRTLLADDRTITARRFLICTGARAATPPIDGLDEVPHSTYETIFDNDRLPAHLLVIGGGPLGTEIAQAYRRLGAAVTIVAPRILAREEPEAAALVHSRFEVEGLGFLTGRARAVAFHNGTIAVRTESAVVRGDMLLVSTGRRPVTDGLRLDRAGVESGDDGVHVDRYLRTTIRHIYAAGDVIGGPQFTHLAGWQCFTAVRNALLPGRDAGTPGALPWTTFLDPEVARVGMSEAEARDRYGDAVRVYTRDLAESDRAICDGETEGLIKIVARRNGRILGATIVASRAGEMITGISLAMRHGLSLSDLSSTIHVYPSWSVPIQQIASDAAVDRFVGSRLGRIALRFSGLRRQRL